MKPAKHQYRWSAVAVSLATIPADIITILTLGFVQPNWPFKVMHWRFKRVATQRRARSTK